VVGRSLPKPRTTKSVSKSTQRAFNDVTEIPGDGVWFQVFHKNGTIEINEGENGLARLDNIVKAAKNNKLHVMFSLTNNWFRNATGTSGSGNKTTKRDGTTVTPVDRRNLPRNYLSNDYG
jgi:mannan endo-1,4-beta-mannosidase